jgi:hypothetical protein
MARREFGAWRIAAWGWVCWGRDGGISGAVNILLRRAERGLSYIEACWAGNANNGYTGSARGCRKRIDCVGCESEAIVCLRAEVGMERSATVGDYRGSGKLESEPRRPATRNRDESMGNDIAPKVPGLKRCISEH